VPALLAVGAVLLFARLGDVYLWQDEAETAVLARHVLWFGYPKASDDVNTLVVPFARHRPGEVWVFHPWLQFYVTAASFFLFGQTTFAARLPFAVCGLLGLWLTWRLTWRLLADRRASLWTLGLLTLSVPYRTGPHRPLPPRSGAPRERRRPDGLDSGWWGSP